MKYKKYQHIERLGTPGVDGITDGICYVFPKIDGTNSQLWFNDGLQAGSRNRQLSIDSDNAGFFRWATENESISKFFEENKHFRLFGEWLVPHTLKTYSDSAWRDFYVFDVMDENDNYVPYESYKQLLEKYGIGYIPAICQVSNPTTERLFDLLKENTYLIKDGEGIGEGIVIKNYDFTNRFGRVNWAKIVSNEFKTNHGKNSTRRVTEKHLIEESIAIEYVTESLVNKEYAKIVNEVGHWESKLIPRLLNVVFYCLIQEECWNFIKKHKRPTINFGMLMKYSNDEVKKHIPNAF